MEKSTSFYSILKKIIVLGNALYILWILRNAITERGGNQTIVETVSLIGLLFLLAFNIFFLWRKELSKS